VAYAWRAVLRPTLLATTPIALLSLLACGSPRAPEHAEVAIPPSASAAAPPPTSSAAAGISAPPPIISELDPAVEEEVDPKALEMFKARMTAAPVPLTPAKLAPRVTLAALDDTRRGEAPGMKADDTVYAANLAEGQRATLPVKMTPGECVTYVAQGGLGLIEVDLFLTAGEGDNARVLAEDPSTGPIGVIGGHGRCFTAKAPIIATLHATARRGAGVVLVQTFRR
jgi:hypothetical protein